MFANELWQALHRARGRETTLFPIAQRLRQGNATIHVLKRVNNTQLIVNQLIALHVFAVKNGAVVFLRGAG
jgi:hypothetical protein